MSRPAIEDRIVEWFNAAPFERVEAIFNVVYGIRRRRAKTDEKVATGQVVPKVRRMRRLDAPGDGGEARV